MSNQNQPSDTFHEKTIVDSPTYVEENVKQGAIIVNEDEEKRILRKIDMQSVSQLRQIWKSDMRIV